MSEKKVLFDIPTSHKEYHNIQYDAEKNRYYMEGHKSDDGVKYLALSIPSSAKITENPMVPEIIDIEIGEMILMLFPFSTMIFYG